MLSLAVSIACLIFRTVFCPCVVIYCLCTYFNSITNASALLLVVLLAVLVLKNVHSLLQVVEILSRAPLPSQKAGILPRGTSASALAVLSQDKIKFKVK